jgi:hypothetical protein
MLENGVARNTDGFDIVAYAGAFQLGRIRAISIRATKEMGADILGRSKELTLAGSLYFETLDRRVVDGMEEVPLLTIVISRNRDGHLFSGVLSDVRFVMEGDTMKAEDLFRFTDDPQVTYVAGGWSGLKRV